MRADRVLVSAFCLQKQKPGSLLELCSASACTISVKGSYDFSLGFVLCSLFYVKEKKKPLKIAATQHCLSFDIFRLVNMTL